MLRRRVFMLLVAFGAVLLLLSCRFDTEKYMQINAKTNQQKKNQKKFTLKSIHLKIWEQIKFLQERRSCLRKKVLHCEITNNYAGFGSILHRYGVCIQVAYGLGRMFIIEPSIYKHFGGLSNWLQIDTRRCNYARKEYNRILADTSQRYKRFCDVHDPKCYLENGYDIDNTYQILTFNPQPAFPTPRHMPGTIPTEIERELRSLNVSDPKLWFAAQFVSYKLLHPKKSFLRQLRKLSAKINYEKPVVAMHIRHGADKMPESNYYSENMYVNKVVEIFQNKLDNSSRRNTYLATDDFGSLFRIEELLPPNYNIITIPIELRQESMTQYNIEAPSKIVIETMLIDLYLLARSDYIVCTLSSNVCRLVWLMKLSKSPYMVNAETIKSLDEDMFYDYYGYQYYPGGFVSASIDYRYFKKTLKRNKKLLVSIRNNFKSIDSDLPFLQYPTGQLFLTLYPKRLFSNNSTHTVDVFLVKYIYNPERNGMGFVYADDMMEWPGKPKYYFDEKIPR